MAIGKTSFRALLTLSALGATQAVSAAKSDGCYHDFVSDFKPDEGYPSRKHTIDDRSSRVFLPPNYKKDEPNPLILAFHGRDMSTRGMEVSSGLSDGTVNPDHVVVYPSAIDGKWLADPMRQNMTEAGFPQFEDETSYLYGLVQYYSSKLCIDTNRIYATGLGTGGGMAAMLACDPEFSKNLAGIGVVSGALYKTDEEGGPWPICKPSWQPLPVLEVHSEKDTEFDYYSEEGYNTQNRLPVSRWFIQWAMRHGCGGVRGPPQPHVSVNATYVTALEHGTISEGVMHKGGAVRAAYRCSHTVENPEEDIENPTPTPKAEADTPITALHYLLKRQAHGWIRTKLPVEDAVIINGKEVNTEGDPNFDTTAVVLDFFRAQTLPDGEEMTKSAERMAAWYVKEEKRQQEELRKLQEADGESPDEQIQKLVAQIKAKQAEQAAKEGADGETDADAQAEPSALEEGEAADSVAGESSKTTAEAEKKPAESTAPVKDEL